jgi:8-oxo-dGTP diphosphatase
MTRIGIAVVEHADHFLIGVRRQDAVLAGYDEFPGGKCHPNESVRDCAVRECKEETGLDVTAVRELLKCQHTYDHGTLDLHFWLCEPVGTECKPRNGFAWIPRTGLADRRFPEANLAVMQLLTRQQ